MNYYELFLEVIETQSVNGLKDLNLKVVKIRRNT